jgi:hypothetical protein
MITSPLCTRLIIAEFRDHRTIEVNNNEGVTLLETTEALSRKVHSVIQSTSKNLREEYIHQPERQEEEFPEGKERNSTL